MQWLSGTSKFLHLRFKFNFELLGKQGKGDDGFYSLFELKKGSIQVALIKENSWTKILVEEMCK